MKQSVIAFIAALAVALGVVALAQTTVKGTVVSEDDGMPVVGASVQIIGTNQGAVTDADGNFSFTTLTYDQSVLENDDGTIAGSKVFTSCRIVERTWGYWAA